MKNKNRFLLSSIFMLTIFISGCATTILKNEGEYSLHIYRPIMMPLQDDTGLSIKGYDTVAYFTEGKAVQGFPEFKESWNGAIWYFSSENNRNIFKINPEQYTPQYGSYCSWSVAKNNYIPPATGDPEAWMIIDNKLYLTYNKQVLGLWKLDLNKNLALSIHQWPIKLELMEQYSMVELPLQ
jgi:YHS domain-containing protein